MDKLLLWALLVSLGLGCSRSALYDEGGLTTNAGGYDGTGATSTTNLGGGSFGGATSRGGSSHYGGTGNVAFGGRNSGGTGNVAFGGHTSGGTGNVAFGGGNSGGTGNVAYGGRSSGGTGNVAGTLLGGAGGTPRVMCPNDRFFGDYLIPTPVPGDIGQTTIVSTLDVDNTLSPDLILFYETMLSVVLGTGKGEFAAHQDYSSWYTMTSPVTADLNQDGYLDVVAASPRRSTLRVFYGSTRGTFGSALDLSLPTLSAPQLLATGNLSSTAGAMDLVVSDGLTYLRLLVRTGSSSYAAWSSIALSSPIEFLRVADVNGDKAPDLLTLGSNSGIGVYLGKGDRTFASRIETTLSGPTRSLTLGTLNGDAFPDLVTTHEKTLIRWIGKGDGTFTPYATTGAAVASKLADLDADGLNDIAAVGGKDQLCIWQGSADVTAWPTPWCTTVTNSPNDLDIADFDGDGSQDIVVSSSSARALVVSWGGPDRRRATDARLVRRDISGIPAAIAIADITGDGLLDVLTAPLDMSYVRIDAGAGNGQFSNAKRIGTDAPVRALINGDFNNDNRVDFAATTTKNTLVVTDRDQTVVTRLPLPAPYDLIATADLNVDGYQDIVLGQRGSTSGITLLGMGDGTFAWGKGFSSIRAMSDIAVGHFDQDDIPDLALGTQAAVVEVSQGMGDGTFSKTNLFSSTGVAHRVQTADINGDRRLDLVVGSDDFGASLLLGKGDLSFEYPTAISMGMPARDLAVADFDGDGMLDILTSDLETSALSLALGKGGGAFRQFQFLVSAIPSQLAVADLNRDGALDVVFGDSQSAAFIALLNVCQ